MKLKRHKINNIMEKKCKKFFKIHEKFYLSIIYIYENLCYTNLYMYYASINIRFKYFCCLLRKLNTEFK